MVHTVVCHTTKERILERTILIETLDDDIYDSERPGNTKTCFLFQFMKDKLNDVIHLPINIMPTVLTAAYTPTFVGLQQNGSAS